MLQATAGNNTAPSASAAGDVYRESSRLGGFEFNTPYSHEIAAVAGLLLVVAIASVILAIKYTQRSPQRETDPDAVNESSYGKGGKTSWECAPIMTRLGRRHSYESLQQTECHDGGAEPRGSFHFSSRLDAANGLLCLYGIRLRLFATGDSQRKLEGWKIAIDIVTQTEVECRQTRLSTQMVAAEPITKDVPGYEKTANVLSVADGGWKSDPMEDVLTVRINQDQQLVGSPLRGQLLIRVLGQKPADPTASHPQHQVPMVKLGSATFPLERIREPQVAAISVTLRNEA